MMVQINPINLVSGPKAIGFKSAVVTRPSDTKSLETSDSFESSKASFDESLMRKYNSTGFFQGYYTMEGSVNNKAVNLKQEYERTGFLTGNRHYTGNIGEDKVDIVLNNRKATGKIGDKIVNLEYRTAFLTNGFSINGTIDGKEINIAKGSSIDAAQGENDVLALVSSLEGMQLRTRNGQFTTYAPSAQQQIDNMEAAMNAQMYQQQMMMSPPYYPMYF